MDFFTETLQIRKEWKIQKAKEQTNPINQENYPANYALKMKVKKKHLRKFIITMLALLRNATGGGGGSFNMKGY